MQLSCKNYYIMGAIAKLLSYPDRILSTFFNKVLPEILHLAILGACIFWKHYMIFKTRNKYAAAIKHSSSRFYYGKGRSRHEECSVCLSDYAAGEECCQVAACGHAFHRRCLDRWLLGYELTCPLCRAAVVPEKVEAEYRRLQVEEGDDWIEKEFALVLLNALDGGRSCCSAFF